MTQLQSDPPMLVSGWCGTCDTQHSIDEDCPGRLVPVEPERHGWRINADTPDGIEAYGVLLTRCTVGFRARILTYPNILWLVPGGRETMKFHGKDVAEAEGKASGFIKAHCSRRGFKLRTELSAVPYLGVDPEGAVARRSGPRPAQRKIRFLPIRFGVGGATEPGGTGNLSETGLFIITNSPVEQGQRVSLALRLEGDRVVRMNGDVVWMNKGHHVGRSPGMGVKLHAPPGDYLDYVKQLT